MSSVNNISNNIPVPKIATPVTKKADTADSSSPAAKSDQVQFSGVSHLLATLKKNDIRTEKVANIRAQIQAGTYETDDKLDAAAGKLLDDISK